MRQPRAGPQLLPPRWLHAHCAMAASIIWAPWQSTSAGATMRCMARCWSCPDPMTMTAARARRWWWLPAARCTLTSCLRASMCCHARSCRPASREEACRRRQARSRCSIPCTRAYPRSLRLLPRMCAACSRLCRLSQPTRPPTRRRTLRSQTQPTSRTRWASDHSQRAPLARCGAHRADSCAGPRGTATGAKARRTPRHQRSSARPDTCSSGC
mmetsp:Transcript_20218/g.62665  ORF Transcript_20218/g.62665 Transcript_20218/m.62665 type:complete len:213 (+) Transcript_20218:696-1334(+)